MSYRVARTTQSQLQKLPEMVYASCLQLNVLTVATFLALLCGTVVSSASLLNQPGTTWSRGLLSGETLRLLDSGAFVWIPFCEFCFDEVATVGEWRSDQGQILLFTGSDASISFRTLEQRVIGNCNTLVEPRQDNDHNPFNAFVRESDSCSVWGAATPCPDEL
jgi:hypothetical protein